MYPVLTLHMGSAMFCSWPLHLPACNCSRRNRLSTACRRSRLTRAGGAGSANIDKEILRNSYGPINDPSQLVLERPNENIKRQRKAKQLDAISISRWRHICTMNLTLFVRFDPWSLASKSRTKTITPQKQSSNLNLIFPNYIALDRVIWTGNPEIYPIFRIVSVLNFSDVLFNYNNDIFLRCRCNRG